MAKIKNIILYFFSDSVDEWKTFQDELSQAAGRHKGLENVFRKHVKPKKQHEIARLCDVIRLDLASFDLTSLIRCYFIWLDTTLYV